jgi:hypothetical protein
MDALVPLASRRGRHEPHVLRTNGRMSLQAMYGIADAGAWVADRSPVPTAPADVGVSEALESGGRIAARPCEGQEPGDGKRSRLGDWDIRR